MNPHEENQPMELERMVGVAPRRTPLEAWLVGQQFLGDLLREFGYAAAPEIVAALQLVSAKVHPLLLMRSLQELRLVGSKFCVALSFDHAASEESDRLDLPLVVEAEPEGNLQLTFLVRREPVLEPLCTELAAYPSAEPLTIAVEFVEDRPIAD